MRGTWPGKDPRAMHLRRIGVPPSVGVPPAGACPGAKRAVRIRRRGRVQPAEARARRALLGEPLRRRDRRLPGREGCIRVCAARGPGARPCRGRLVVGFGGGGFEAVLGCHGRGDRAAGAVRLGVGAIGMPVALLFRGEWARGLSVGADINVFA